MFALAQVDQSIRFRDVPDCLRDSVCHRAPFLRVYGGDLVDGSRSFPTTCIPNYAIASVAAIPPSIYSRGH